MSRVITLAFVTFIKHLIPNESVCMISTYAPSGRVKRAHKVLLSFIITMFG